jgi:ParB-like chromosome segregation protein Spo0J
MQTVVMGETSVKTGHQFAELLPPLSPDEKSALKASIKQYGVRDSVLVDEDGNVIDGRHRLKIDKNAPRKVIKGLTEAEKKALVFQSNFACRNLSHEQRKEVLKSMKGVAKELKQEGKTQTVIAGMLGVSQNTVSDWLTTKRRNNIGTDNVSQADCRVKINPKAKPLILERVENGETPEQVAADLKVTSRRIQQIVKSEGKIVKEKERRKKAAATSKTNSCIEHGDFRELGKSIPDNSVDLIFTDPPYVKDSIPLWFDLSVFASRVLRPGGWCLAYSGHFFLPDCLAALSEHLEYGWMFAIQHSGGDARFRNLKLQVKWKPVMGFYKPPLSAWWDWFPDCVTGGREKDSHPWQQAQAEAEHFIEALAPKGGTVCDPFCGSGTSCAAAKATKRKWIGFEIDETHVETARARLCEMD